VEEVARTGTLALSDYDLSGLDRQKDLPCRRSRNATGTQSGAGQTIWISIWMTILAKDLASPGPAHPASPGMPEIEFDLDFNLDDC